MRVAATVMKMTSGKLTIDDVKKTIEAFDRVCIEPVQKAFVVTLRNTPYKSVLVANATLLLISAATYFLRRQIESKAKTFLANGGFAERMDRMRRKKRNGRTDKNG